MNQYVVAITLDKVQNFLYQTFKSNTVEDQSEGDTLQKVIQASRELSERFPDKINEVFRKAGCVISEEDKIVQTSGKFIFFTRLSGDKIKACLQELFRYYYLREIGQKHSKDNLKSKGQMRLNYTYFDLTSEEIKEFEKKVGIKISSDDKMRAVRIATDKFKLSGTMTKVIEDNADVLFDFPCKDKLEFEEPLEFDSGGTDGIFAKNIDDLKNELAQNDDKSEEGDFFRVAVIKADLDGMSDLFQGLSSHKKYKAVSEVLNEFICINKLEEMMKSKRKEQQKFHKYFKLLPLYVAGDDIFFIANVAHIFTALDLLSSLLNRINEKLTECGEKEQLSLSVGIDVVAHSLPLRYMYDQVESQLNYAKEYKSNTGNVRVNISMYNQIFHIFKKTTTQILKTDSEAVKKGKEKTIKKEIEELRAGLIDEGKDFDNGWSKFRREIALIQEMTDNQGEENDNKVANRREENIGFTYIYNLLEKSTMDQVKNNNQKYVNVILDHLVPDLEEKTHNNQVKNVLLNQLILEYNPDEKFNERKLMFNEASYRAKFEKKLRLFLLFSGKRYKAIIKGTSEKERELKSSLVLKPMRHLYNLTQESDIGKLFVKFAKSDKLDEKGEIETDRDGNVIKTDYYQRVPVKTSMFHRLKKFYKKDEIGTEKSVEAIFNVVDSVTKMKDDNKDNSASKQKSNKTDREYDREFKEEQKKEFVKLAKKDGNWNEDVIDSLMILYKYIDVLEYWAVGKKKVEAVLNEGN